MNPPTSPGRSSGGVPFWEPPSPGELSAALPAYEVTALLGRGGMGAVYRAVQRSLKREVAIKVLAPTADDELKFAERFRHEAETLARLNHPGIVHIHDFGETTDGLLYLVMEFVDGTDVHQLIQGSGRLSEEYALAITAHVCDALTYAHSRGIVHRDIKPANVLIDQDGNVKVADFGLAKMVDPQFDSGLTMSNVALGTPDYVAPEVLSFGMEVDHRADLYAVGVMLYQMLTGELPRGLFKLPSQKYQEIDPRLDGVICRALEPDRDERYQSAVEVRAELFEISTARLARMDEASFVVATPMPRRPNRRKTAAMITGLAVLVAAGTWGWKTLSGRGSASTTAPPAEIDLLKSVDLKRDVIAGDWYWDPRGLRSRGSGMVPGFRGGYPRVEFAQVPPSEYDFEVEFTADTDELDAGLVFSIGGKQTALIMNIHGGTGYIAGLDGVSGAPMHMRLTNDGRPSPYFKKGERQVALVQVRKDRVTTLLDGEVIEDWTVPSNLLNDLALGSDYILSDPAYLGLLAAPATPVVFHRVVVREVGETSSSGTNSSPSQTPTKPEPVGPDNVRPEEIGYSWSDVLKGKEWNPPWQFKEGALRATEKNQTLYLGVHRDGVVRLKMRRVPELEISGYHPLFSLTVRGTRESGGSYQFQIVPQKKISNLLFLPEDPSTGQAGAPQFLWENRPLTWEEDELELKFVVDDHRLSLWSGGKEIAGVEDTRSPTGSWVAIISPGIEILELSLGLPAAEETSLPGITWSDVTARVREEAKNNPKLSVEEEGIRRIGEGSPIAVPVTDPSWRNYAVRVRHTGGAQINLRSSDENGFIYALCQGTQSLLQRWAIPKSENVILTPPVPHPPGYDNSAPHEFIARVEDNLIRTWVDGVRAGQVRDNALAEGVGAMMWVKGSLVHSVEVAQLPDPAHPKLDKSFWGQIGEGNAERRIEIVEAALESINGNDLSLKPTFEGGKVVALTITKQDGNPLHDLAPVAALTDLKTLFCYAPGVRDLEWLRGMPIENLQLTHAEVENLDVLRETKVNYLTLGTPDKPPRTYEVLAGLPVRSLNLKDCPIKDLSFLSGMPLDRLVLAGTGITDYTPLKAFPLAEVDVDLVPERDLPILLSIPTLKKINGKPVEEYRGK